MFKGFFNLYILGAYHTMGEPAKQILSFIQ